MKTRVGEQRFDLCAAKCGGAPSEMVAGGYPRDTTRHEVVEVGPSRLCEQGVAHWEATYKCLACGATHKEGESNYSDPSPIY